MTASPIPSLLIVDDAKAVRLLVEKMLLPYRVEVREAANGYNALFAMEKVLPDLLVLDVNMPVMSGFELLQMMKEHATLKRIPVIMLPSRPDHAMLPQLTALGADALVMKPFTEAGLLAQIRTLLPLTAR